MTKQKLIEILKRLLNTDTNLDFLFKLEMDELERLVSIIRERIDSK